MIDKIYINAKCAWIFLVVVVARMRISTSIYGAIEADETLSDDRESENIV